MKGQREKKGSKSNQQIVNADIKENKQQEKTAKRKHDDEEALENQQRKIQDEYQQGCIEDDPPGLSPSDTEYEDANRDDNFDNNSETRQNISEDKSNNMKRNLLDLSNTAGASLRFGAFYSNCCYLLKFSSRSD